MKNFPVRYTPTGGYIFSPNGIKNMCPPVLPVFLPNENTRQRNDVRLFSPSFIWEMNGKNMVSERFASLRWR